MSYTLKLRLLTSLFMSCCMALIMSGFATWRHLPTLEAGFLASWISAFIPAWGVAFVTAFLIQPAVKGLVESLLKFLSR